MSAFQNYENLIHVPTNAGNLLLLLWCCCSDAAAGVHLESKGVRLSPDIPGNSRERWVESWCASCLPLAGCVTFAKSHSPLWASVGFWNEGAEFDSQVPLELRNRMSYIRNSGLEQGFGTQPLQCWKAGSLSETGSSRVADLELSHPQESGGQRLTPFVEMSPRAAPNNQFSYCFPLSTHPPSTVPMIKCSSSKKMGGSPQRGMNQQAQREKEGRPVGVLGQAN